MSRLCDQSVAAGSLLQVGAGDEYFEALFKIGQLQRRLEIRGSHNPKSVLAVHELTIEADTQWRQRHHDRRLLGRRKSQVNVLEKVLQAPVKPIVTPVLATPDRVGVRGPTPRQSIRFLPDHRVTLATQPFQL
jgi:hypothetical protein